jgi:hypothetical protein
MAYRVTVTVTVTDTFTFTVTVTVTVTGMQMSAGNVISLARLGLHALSQLKLCICTDCQSFMRGKEDAFSCIIILSVDSFRVSAKIYILLG